MNKKLFLGMFAAVGMLLATSCSNDELDAVQSGNEATISFNLGVEDGVQTRAISDGKTANRLVYAVFNEKGERITTIAKIDKTTTFPTTETITLAKGQTYKVAFWAQNSATSAYVLDDDMNLTIDYTTGTNNAEERDAFFKTVEFTVTGNQPVDVVLKRPFAQINVGVTEKDWNAAVASGIEIATSKVVIKNAATKMNLLDGSIPKGAFEEITYDFGATPKSNGEVLSVDLDRDGTAEPYNYLSMSYILVYDENGGAQKALLEDLDFTFHPLNGNDIVIGEKEGLNSVPVQRNWRTNIIGQLLTGDVDFKISIDPIYDGEYNNGTAYPVELNGVYYKTIEEALAVAVDGNTINLAVGEHSFPHYIKLSGKPEGKITFAGEGEGTVVNGIDWPNNHAMPGTYADGVDLVMKNLTYKTNNDYMTAGFTRANSVTFEDCNIEGGYHTFGSDANKAKHLFKNCNIDPKDDYITVYGADCVFEGCTFESSEGKAVYVYSEGFDGTFDVTIKDCTFEAAKFGTDQWYNGPITAIDIQAIRGNKFNVKISNCTATGYAIGDYSGSPLWNVRAVPANDPNVKGTEEVTVFVDGKQATDIVEVNGVKYGNIAAALADVAAGGTATINLEEGTYLLPNEAKGKTLIFVGTGNATNTVINVRANGDANADCALDGSTVTFENVSINAASVKNQYLGFARCNATYKNCIINGELTLYHQDSEGYNKFENCAFNVVGNGDMYNVWTYSADATFSNCTFNSHGKAVLVYGARPESTVTFTTCDFNDFGGQDGKAAIETGDDWGTVKYTININSCEVNGFDVNAISGSNVWGNKNSMSAENLNVFIDNVEVY